MTPFSRQSFSVALAFAAASGLPALASQVEGFGSIKTNLSDPALVQIDKAYQDPLSLVVGDTLQLTPVELGATGGKVLQYGGEAQFGRLGVATHIGGVTGALTLSSSVNAFVSSKDLISPTNLNPVGASFLRLDVGLSGNMQRNDSDFGNGTFAQFALHLIDPLNPDNFNQVSTLSFSWSDTRQITNEHGAGVGGFIASPGQEPRFTFLPSGGPVPTPDFGYFFGASGHIDVPLDGNVQGFFGSPFLTRGAPFLLEFVVGAFSSCADETPVCSAHTDFGSTALIGNARIVDQNGNVVPGASFTTESGYDYITPPGSLVVSTPIPEPETWALLLVGLGVLGARARRHARR